jgi:hypothetical protein
VNGIKILGEDVDESIIVKKVLRSLPMRFDPNISTLEDRTNLDSISMDELHGIFASYEMRKEHVIDSSYKRSNIQSIQEVKEKGKAKDKVIM